LAMTKKKLENTFTAMRNYGMEDRASWTSITEDAY
jgi:hypothetical protein